MWNAHKHKQKNTLLYFTVGICNIISTFCAQCVHGVVYKLKKIKKKKTCGFLRP